MSIARLRDFVSEVTDIVHDGVHEAAILDHLHTPMSRLLAHDDWLPDAFAAPHPDALTAVPAALRSETALFRRELRLGAGYVQRHVYDEAAGSATAFVSGFSSSVAPNLWMLTNEERRSAAA